MTGHTAFFEDGESHIDDLEIERDSVSAAFDWQATDDLLLALDLSWRDYPTNARQAYWFLAPGVDRPDAAAIDSSKAGISSAEVRYDRYTPIGAQVRSFGAGYSAVGTVSERPWAY